MLTGGVDANALKDQDFGAARNVRGRIVAIISTALIDTGRMDEVIFEEFKGT